MTFEYPTAFSRWGAEEHSAMMRVIASGKFTMGAETEALEAEFAVYHGMKHGIAVNSGSSANLVAVAALFHKAENPLRPGDRAIVPAIAWATTYAPLVQYGLNLHIFDVDDTWNAAKSQLAPIPDDTHLIIGCSILGNPAHLPCWRDLSPFIYHIEDNCESLGASKHDQLCGTFGLMNTFSFFFSHQISAIEGGMILTDDDEVARLCRLIRNHGNAGFLNKDAAFDASYDFVLHGYNVRPLEMHCAIAREQLKKVKSFQLKRCENLSHFWNMAARAPIIRPKLNGTINPFGIAFECESKDVRSRLVAALHRNGIDCRLPTGGSFTRHLYGRRWANQATPRADEIHERGLFLGLAPYDITPLIERAAKVIRETV